MKIGRIGYQTRFTQIRLDFQRGQPELVGHRISVWIGIIEMPGVGIRVSRPVGRIVVLLAILVKEARCDGDRVHGLPHACQAQHERFVGVGILVDNRAGRRIHPIDPTAVLAVPGTDAKSEDPVDYGPTLSNACLVARLAVLRK